MSSEQDQIDQLATMFGQALGMMASPIPPSPHTLEHFLSYHEAASTTLSEKRMFEYIRFGMEAMLGSLRRAKTIPQDYMKEDPMQTLSKAHRNDSNTDHQSDDNA